MHFACLRLVTLGPARDIHLTARVMGSDVEARLLPAGERDMNAEQSPSSYGSIRSVRVARIGELPHGGGAKLSRDGSVHVTDEVCPSLPYVERCSTQLGLRRALGTPLGSCVFLHRNAPRKRCFCDPRSCATSRCGLFARFSTRLLTS